MINKTLNWYATSDRGPLTLCILIVLIGCMSFQVGLNSATPANNKALQEALAESVARGAEIQQKGEVILADAKELTRALKKHAVANDLPPDTEVEFAEIQQYLTPGSDLEKGHGLDVYGLEYGPFIVGRLVPVNESTKEFLDPYVETGRTSADRDGFWDGH